MLLLRCIDIFGLPASGWLQVLLLNYFGGAQNRKVAEMSDEELVEQVCA